MPVQPDADAPAVVSPPVDAVVPPPDVAPAVAVAVGEGKVVDVSAGLPQKLQMLAAVPGKSTVVAIAGEWNITGTVLATSDGGATWVEQGKGMGTLPLKLLPLGVLMDPERGGTFWVWGNWTSGNSGILVSSDAGNTLGSGHAYEAEGLSVNFADPARKVMVYGQHEATRSVFRSVNGGQSWTQIGKTLPPDAGLCEFPLVIDEQTYLIGCSMMVFGTPPPKGNVGIFRTSDGGATWTKMASQPVFKSPLVAGQSIYWSYYNVATADGGLVSSDDLGLTWKVATASGLKHSSVPVALPGGRIATLKKGNVLVLSADGGTTWTEARPAPTLKSASGVTYSAALDAFFLWEGSGHAQRVDYVP